MTKTVGVLALQGAFIEHIKILQEIGANAIEVRTEAELFSCDGLIIPGGESTTMSLVAERSGMLDPLRKFVKDPSKAVWGTCAGMIFLAKHASNQRQGGQELLGALDVTVERNHFGRQNESFVADLDLTIFGHSGKPFKCIFIRAPVVTAVGEGVEVLGTVPRTVSTAANETVDQIVAVKQGNIFATSFHPELTKDNRLHQWWLSTV